VGAVDRALYELLNLDVYDLVGLEVDAYDGFVPPWPHEMAADRPVLTLVIRSRAR
jgi:hypothetical protein